jgi:hypothetical protein
VKHEDVGEGTCKDKNVILDSPDSVQPQQSGHLEKTSPKLRMLECSPHMREDTLHGVMILAKIRAFQSAGMESVNPERRDLVTRLAIGAWSFGGQAIGAF